LDDVPASGRRPIGANVRAGVCVEFRSKGSPVRGGGGGVRASATAGDPSRPRPTIDFLTPGGGGGGGVSRDRYFPFAAVVVRFRRLARLHKRKRAPVRCARHPQMDFSVSRFLLHVLT